ncbi:MAG TPA: hypothetical protein VMJ65_13150 [Solirubrobacteraceae bacterium]|nr:hypothetical protein [Solirubrobacteraceae bacterium]
MDASVNSTSLCGDDERGLLGDIDGVVRDPLNAPCDEHVLER